MQVLFVAPTLSANTLQSIHALVSLPGVRTGIITNVPARAVDLLRAGR